MYVLYYVNIDDKNTDSKLKELIMILIRSQKDKIVVVLLALICSVIYFYQDRNIELKKFNAVITRDLEHLNNYLDILQRDLLKISYSLQTYPLQNEGVVNTA